MPAEITIVTVYFRKERLSVMLDTDEVMLAPRVVVVVECIEGLDLHNNCVSHPGLKRRRPGRYHDAATPESFPEDIVQCAYLSALSPTSPI